MKPSFISNFEPERKYRLRKSWAVGFVGLVVVSLVLLEGLNRSHFVKTLSTNYQVIEAFRDREDPIEILFLGNSHFLNGIQAEKISPRAFNLSFPGANMIQNYFLLKHFLPGMKSLRTVIIPLEPNTFSSVHLFLLNEPNALFWDAYMDFGELAADFGPQVYLKRLKTITVMDELLGRKYLIRNLLKYGFGRGAAQTRADEAGPERMLAKVRPAQVEERIRWYFQDRELLNPALLKYWGRIVQLCAARHIQVISLETPVSKIYDTLSGTYVSQKDLDQAVSGFLPDSGYRHLNYRDYFGSREDVFKEDGDHLNPRGAVLFSEALGRDLREQGIVRTA